VKEGTSMVMIITLYRNGGYMYVKEENVFIINTEVLLLHINVTSLPI
jgi:hypothetical protein